MKDVNVEKFMKLVQENPGLPVKVLMKYPDEEWYDGEIQGCEIGKLVYYQPYRGDDVICYRTTDIDQIIEDIYDKLLGEVNDWDDGERYTCDDLREIAERMAQNLRWEKYIILYVGA